MDSIGKIGVLLPEIVDPLDYELLRGFHTEAAALTSMQRFAGFGKIFRKIRRRTGISPILPRGCASAKAICTGFINRFLMSI